MTETLTALLAANPVERYLRFLLADDPFRGLYNLNAFDLFLLIPYFAILGTLAFYGLHRYRMIYLYKKYAHRQPPPPVNLSQKKIRPPAAPRPGRARRVADGNRPAAALQREVRRRALD